MPQGSFQTANLTFAESKYRATKIEQIGFAPVNKICHIRTSQSEARLYIISELLLFSFQTGQLVELSAQQVIDCSWGSGNHGCRGGWYNKALSWIYMNGVAKAKNYGPYLAQVRHVWKLHCKIEIFSAKMYMIFSTTSNQRQ